MAPPQTSQTANLPALFLFYLALSVLITQLSHIENSAYALINLCWHQLAPSKKQNEGYSGEIDLHPYLML
jgi:hypothetical protein